MGGERCSRIGISTRGDATNLIRLSKPILDFEVFVFVILFVFVIVFVFVIQFVLVIVFVFVFVSIEMFFLLLLWQTTILQWLLLGGLKGMDFIFLPQSVSDLKGRLNSRLLGREPSLQVCQIII